MIGEKLVQYTAAVKDKALESGYLAPLEKFNSAMAGIAITSASRNALTKTYQTARFAALEAIQQGLAGHPDLEQKLLEAGQVNRFACRLHRYAQLCAVMT